MSLDLRTLIFPNNAVELIASRFEMSDLNNLVTTNGLTDTLTVLRRDLRASDPNYSVGVTAVDWAPTPNSMEMTGVLGTHASTLEQYMISITAFVKTEDEAAGLIAHSVLAKAIRTTLAADLPLRSQLGGLTATFNGETESLKRFWMKSSRYRSNKVQGANMYLSVNDLMIEVEKVIS